MAEPITATEFHEHHDLPDWRFLLRRIEACFRAPSFAAAAGFVERVATLADEADHHPDVDLRYPGRVHVALTTHAVRDITALDVDLAGRISQLARDLGLVAEPVSSPSLEVAIDALDIDAVRPFWAAVLGYDEQPPRSLGGQVDVLVDPLRIGPRVWFQQMDAPRPQRNRIHVDVNVPHDQAEARVAAALAAGGHLVSDADARSWWVLADAEGNEACVCTWQDRD